MVREAFRRGATTPCRSKMREDKAADSRESELQIEDPSWFARIGQDCRPAGRGCAPPASRAGSEPSPTENPEDRDDHNEPNPPKPGPSAADACRGDGAVFGILNLSVFWHMFAPYSSFHPSDLFGISLFDVNRSWALLQANRARPSA